jgi:integrase
MKSRAARAITEEEYRELIETMRQGGCGFKPSDRNATAFVLQANLGLRIGDVLDLRPSSFIKDGGRWRLDIIESKTGKVRNFTVPTALYMYIENYCLRNGIGRDDRIFPLSVRVIQEYLQKVVDYLDLQGNVTSHSFRKFYATKIYNTNGHDVALVQRLLQHASPATTQRYIGIQNERIEAAIENNLDLI